MKSLIQLSLIIVIIASGCSAGRNATERKEILLNGRESESGCFAIFKDGTIENYKTLELKTSVFSRPYLLADGKTKIFQDDIEAYRTDKCYAISQIRYGKNDHSKVADECLPGFAVRIAKGKLNVYDRKCMRSGNNREFFLQTGDNRPVFEYTPELMNAVIKYHYEAYNYFNKPKKIKLLTKIYTAADLYNNAPSYTKR